MPLFSIITVTRNNLAGLKKTAESVAAQTVTDYEWVVIDGASDDGTREYLQDAAATYWSSEPDQGIYDAMNKGLARAKGDHLIFLNAGDIFADSHTLETIARHAGADFIYGDAREDHHYKRGRSHKRLKYGMFTHHQAMAYRRTTIENLRYDTSYKIAADYKFTIEALKKSETISYIPQELCVFESGGVSQINPARGRREQQRARAETKLCGALENTAIAGAQAALMIFRRRWPALYWWLKRPSGNSARGSSQI